VGPRSALFTPVKNIGLIVIDEAHESSYKQDQSPYYQSTRVAAKLSDINNALLILGSATPLIGDYYYFKAKNLLIPRMTKPAITINKNKNNISIDVVKLSDKSNFTKSRWLSNQLITSISDSLNSKEQSIVFINRRGTAQVIVCQNCGWQAVCPNCDTSLTYHADSHSMMCHSCNFNKLIPSECPLCKSVDIVFKGTGTKAITDELGRLFKTANISRFDRDNKKADTLEHNFDDLMSGKIDIAVGTQIITKGLDLPKLSTVGIVMADSSLYFPDYTAEERTYQNISQVIGRVGRGHIPGRVIVQSYEPNRLSIKSAINKDYESFYDSQIIERKKYKFPPFVYLLKITCKRSTQNSSEQYCEKLIKDIGLLNIPIIINGPTPAFHEKVNNKYVWQIIIKSVNRDNLIRIVTEIKGDYTYDIDPSSLL
jgi:primosomal protein N' (replication factor Y)